MLLQSFFWLVAYGKQAELSIYVGYGMALNVFEKGSVRFGYCLDFCLVTMALLL